MIGQWPRPETKPLVLPLENMLDEFHALHGEAKAIVAMLAIVDEERRRPGRCSISYKAIVAHAESRLPIITERRSVLRKSIQQMLVVTPVLGPRGAMVQK